MKSSTMKSAMKSSAMKKDAKREPNEYFKLVNEARKNGAASFMYKGAKYIQSPTNPILYKKA